MNSYSTSEDRRAFGMQDEEPEGKVLVDEKSITTRDNEEATIDHGKIVNAKSEIEVLEKEKNINETSKIEDEDSATKAQTLTKNHKKMIKLMQGTLEENLKNRYLKILDGSMVSKKRKRVNVCQCCVPCSTFKITSIMNVMGDGSSFILKKYPIPTKEWARIYHRRLIQQNAFCDSSSVFNPIFL